MLAHWHLLTEKLKNIQNSLCTLKFLLSWNRQEFRDLEISRWVGVITWAMIAHLHFDFWIPSSINLHISVLYKTSHPPNLRRLTSTSYWSIRLCGYDNIHFGKSSYSAKIMINSVSNDFVLLFTTWINRTCKYKLDREAPHSYFSLKTEFYSLRRHVCGAFEFVLSSIWGNLMRLFILSNIRINHLCL